MTAYVTLATYWGYCGAMVYLMFNSDCIKAGLPPSASLYKCMAFGGFLLPAMLTLKAVGK